MDNVLFHLSVLSLSSKTLFIIPENTMPLKVKKGKAIPVTGRGGP
jgi:hypothetical protein